MKQILIRCDASERVGHGHAMRCLALAEAMEANKDEPVFLMAETTEFFERQLSKQGIRLIKQTTVTGARGDFALTAQQAELRGIKNIVLDSYEIDYDKQLEEENLNVIRITDSGPIMYRDEIWQEWKQAFEVQEVKNIFVRVDERIEKLCKKVIDNLGLNMISPDGDRIVWNMKKSDIAISAAGVTCWELAAVGVPMALTVLSDDQWPNYDRLTRNGEAAIPLSYHAHINKKQIKLVLETLIDDTYKRQSMSYKAKGMIGRNGTDYYLGKVV